MPALQIYRSDRGPELLGTMWTLQKTRRTAVCTISTHGLGWELVARVDGELIQSEVCKTEMPVFDTADMWRRAWEEKGWATPSASALPIPSE